VFTYTSFDTRLVPLRRPVVDGICKFLGVDPVCIDSMLFSAHHSPTGTLGIVVDDDYADTLTLALDDYKPTLWEYDLPGEEAPLKVFVTVRDVKIVWDSFGSYQVI
jgi:hypothetical protein